MAGFWGALSGSFVGGLLTLPVYAVGRAVGIDINPELTKAINSGKIAEMVTEGAAMVLTGALAAAPLVLTGAALLSPPGLVALAAGAAIAYVAGDSIRQAAHFVKGAAQEIAAEISAPNAAPSAPTGNVPARAATPDLGPQSSLDNTVRPYPAAAATVNLAEAMPPAAKKDEPAATPEATQPSPVRTAEATPTPAKPLNAPAASV